MKMIEPYRFWIDILMNSSKSFILIEVGRTTLFLPLSGFKFQLKFSSHSIEFNLDGKFFNSCNLNALSACA